MSRIETGRSGAKASDVRLLLDAYEVCDCQLRALLEALAGAADGDRSARHQWWHA